MRRFIGLGVAMSSRMTFSRRYGRAGVSRTEVRFRWLRPDASTFAELRAQGVRGVTLDGVRLPPPEDGRLRVSRTGGDLAVLGVEAGAGDSPEGRGLSPRTAAPVRSRSI